MTTTRQATDVQTCSLTLWTEPSNRDYRQLSQNWLNAEYYAIAWNLAVHRALQLFDTVEIFTDQYGLRYLQSIGVEPTEFHVTLDELARDRIDPTFWAYGKIHTYKQLAERGEPFLHIDGDVILGERPNDELLTRDLWAQNCEAGEWFQRVYEHPSSFLYKNLPHRPQSWVSQFHRIKMASCMGIVGGWRTDAFGDYADQAIELVTHPANQKVWGRIPRKDWYNTSVEQYTFNLVAADYGIEVGAILGADEIGRVYSRDDDGGYFHIWGEKKTESVYLDLKGQLLAEAPEKLQTLQDFLR